MSALLLHVCAGTAPRTPPAASPTKGLRGPKQSRPATRWRAIFVDVDGVLHPTVDSAVAGTEAVSTTLFGWLPLLSRLVLPYSDVWLVVHSTWRYTHDIAELRELLGPLGPRVVGVTPRGQRYESIQWWLQQNPDCKSHRILDDAPLEFPVPPPAELIVCDPSKGVSDPGVQSALRAWLEERDVDI